MLNCMVTSNLYSPQSGKSPTFVGVIYAVLIFVALACTVVRTSPLGAVVSYHSVPVCVHFT